jgi:hypothetical protein
MHSQIRHVTAALAVVVSLMASASCGDVVRQGRSPSFLVIDLLTAASGARAGTFGQTLESDVLTYVTQTVEGKQVKVATIFEDLGQVQLRILLKDQGNPGATSSPSNINIITVNRYRVVYKRSDGRNTAGVDVPYPFDGAVTATITNTPVQLSFILVRIQAKLEPPLKPLAGLGGRIAISTIADVTFYGRDQAGNEVECVGSLSINFADWGDPQ